MKLIDNINDLWGDDLKKTITPGAKLKIMASSFSIYAYEALKEELEKIDSLQFIFTEPAFVPAEVTDNITRQHKEFHIPDLMREKNVCGNEFEIHLKNKLTQRAIARECADWIWRKTQFRTVNTDKETMQQFAYLEESEDDNCTYMPLQGFSAVDLGFEKGQATSNFIHKVTDTTQTKCYMELFNGIWNDRTKLSDVTERICSHIESVYKENSPEKIYFLMLYNIFNEFLEDLNDDVLPNSLTGYKESIVWNKLYNFQRDAATGIINKLEKYNGCILADSVGLGKTFTALAVIKYYELKNRTVLVLCPKKLAENWTNYVRNYATNVLAGDRLRYDVLCHTDLQRTRGTSLGIELDKIEWSNYDLVVIDESHNFRNNEVFKEKETRYQRLLNSVIRAGVKTKVLMLSATPVNNRFNDLKNQLALAYEGESENLSSKLKITKSIDEIFRHAQVVFNQWSKLPLEERTAEAILDALDFDFFELLDSVTIARSRKHIETFYDTSDIGKFPTRRKPLTFRCCLTKRPDVIGFNDIFKDLSLLHLSIYTPILYLLNSKIGKYEELYDTVVEGRGQLHQRDREKSLRSLMRTNLLKRLESSVESFRLTLQVLQEKHETMLSIIDKFRTSGKNDELSNTDLYDEDLENEDDEFAGFSEFMIGNKIQIDLNDMDYDSFERDLKEDLEVITRLLAEMDKVTPEDDEKLQVLKRHIQEKIDTPINPGNKKVIIFTAYADTANYLYEHIASDFLTQGIHSGRVTGKDSPKTTLKTGYDFQSILTLFSPISKEKDKNNALKDDPGVIDILIGTDCISEGQNLQDCDYLINYDIHWNPVRIIQRFGRVDRIGSRNETIQLVNFWPNISLDDYINLKERVENRMHIVDLTSTGDDNVLSAKANDVSYRREQLRKLQDEVIEIEELKTGINITDLGLNDFRMDLLDYCKTKDDLSHLPGGLHAVIGAHEELGLKPGVIFTLRNRNQGVNINQHNRLHPYYLVYIGNDGEVITDHTRVKHLLDLVRKSCKGIDEPVTHLCKAFNVETDEGREMSVYSNLLDKSIRSIINVKEDKDIDSLFTGRQTSALVDTIKGLNDFELITFLVIKD